jgi:hypothetical protein
LSEQVWPEVYNGDMSTTMETTVQLRLATPKKSVVYRHQRYDIRCRVVEVHHSYVVTRPIDCEGATSEEAVTFDVGSFMSNWMPEPGAVEPQQL